MKHEGVCMCQGLKNFLCALLRLLVFACTTVKKRAPCELYVFVTDIPCSSKGCLVIEIYTKFFRPELDNNLYQAFHF